MARQKRAANPGPRTGELVRVSQGPRRGERGEVTSVLSDGGVLYYQVRLRPARPEAAAASATVALFLEAQLERTAPDSRA